MREIIIDIHDGTVTIKTQGFKGKSCQEATRELERILGGTAKGAETLTPEYRQAETHATTTTRS